MTRYQPPRGTRDFLPAEMAVRNHVERVVRAAFESFGFQQIQTPIFEKEELFASSAGISEELFRFVSDTDRCTLRPEWTAPVGRLVASGSLADLPWPYKLYYFGPCFRYDQYRVRSHEFHQAGIELLGHREEVADAEAIAVAVKALKWLGVTQFQLCLGDVGVFRQLLEQYLPSNELKQERQSQIISDINKIMGIRKKCQILADESGLTHNGRAYLKIKANELHKIQERCDYGGEHQIPPDHEVTPDQLALAAEAIYGASWVKQELLSEEKADLLLRVSRIRGAASFAIPAARQELVGTTALQSLEDLARVCDWLPAFGVPNFEVVLGVARDMDFYTGTVFEIHSPLLDSEQQFCGGGRYDKLVEEFGGPPTPATGFAFEFDSLVEVFKKSSAGSGGALDASAVDVIVVSPPAKQRLAVEVAERLREGPAAFRVGLATTGSESQPGNDKRIGVAFVVLLGQDDMGDDRCILRQGTERMDTVLLSQLPETLKRLKTERRE